METNPGTPNLFEPLLTLADIRQIFPGIDEKTIYNWRQAKILVDKVIGGILFFSPQDVAFIKANGMSYSQARGNNKTAKKKLPKKKAPVKKPTNTKKGSQ